MKHCTNTMSPTPRHVCALYLVPKKHQSGNHANLWGGRATSENWWQQTFQK